MWYYFFFFQAEDGIRDLTVTGVQTCALPIQSCNNVFVGNNLQGNIGGLGAVFDTTSGANTLVGNGTNVINLGAQDCDGDGVADPNVISGASLKLRGVPLGVTVSGAVRGRLR